MAGIKQQGVSPEDLLYLQAHTYIMKAISQGREVEKYPLTDKMHQEGFQGEVITGLLFADDSEFDFCCQFFREVNLLLKRLQKKRQKPRLEKQKSTLEPHHDSLGELNTLFSGLTGNYASGTARKKTLKAIAQIRTYAIREGGEKRRRIVAERMRKLGFPPYTIHTITGLDPGGHGGG